jgi:hypothetical protein
MLVLQDVKCCFSDDTLPDGYAVNKGDMVHYQPYQMGRMQFLWGADAEEFRPERWLDDDGVFVPESPFKFTAFQVGCDIRSPCHSQCPSRNACSIQHVTCLVSCVVCRLALASAWERNSRTGR